MVVEREPPKSALLSPVKQKNPAPQTEYLEKEAAKTTGISHGRPDQPIFGNIQHPEFGKASPLNNKLQSSVFNIPKRYQQRLEHHRPAPAGHSNLQEKDQIQSSKGPDHPHQSAQPIHNVKIPNGADVVEIPRPANHPIWSTHRPIQPTFSSFVPATVNARSAVGNFIDLTATINQFTPVNTTWDNRFGVIDPYEYVDVGKATENIKALLEGAFDDDDDDEKPRTRARKKKVEAAAISGLVGKLQNLDVEKGQNQEELNDDEENEDDGMIEGLQIQLLPHQVEGVEWMRDKEIGTKKKSGVLPKGGILADDVRPLGGIKGVADCGIDGSWENHTVHITHAHKSTTSSFIKWSR